MFSSHIPRSPRATKLSIEDINSRIECITKVINTMSNDDRAYYNARVRSIELKKQKMLTLAAFAQTQSMQRVLAEMDVLVAENDLIIEIESIRRAKKFKSSEKHILSGSTRTMDDLDETLVIEGISSGSSTPIKKDSTSITKEKQPFSVAKLDTTHDIITLRAQETLQNIRQTDKENVELNSNVVNKPPSCHVEQNIYSNTEKTNSEITRFQTEQNFSDIHIKEIPPQESQQIIKNQIKVTQPKCLDTTRMFESVKETTLSEHVPHPETNKSIEFTSPQKVTPSTPEIPKERKKKLSKKEKSRLFKAPKVAKITEKMCKSKASVLASPTTPEVTIVKLTMDTNITNEVPTKQVNAGISVGGSFGGIKAKTDANQTKELPDVTKSHKTVVNLCKTFEKIYSPEATVPLEPQIVKDLPTITISNVNQAVSNSSDKSCNPDGPTIKDIEALDISISKKKLVAQESSANDSKMPHSSLTVAKNTKKSHDSLEGPSNKDKIPHDCKDISTKKAKKSDKHEKPHDLTHSSAKKDKMSSSLEVPIGKTNSFDGSSETPSNKYRLYRISPSSLEVPVRKTNTSRGSSESSLNKYRMYGISSGSLEVPIRKTEYSPKSAEASSNKHRVSHYSKEIPTKNDNKLQGFTDFFEKKISKPEYSESYINKDKKPHKLIEPTKKDKMSPSSSETSTRKTKRPHDSLELSTHITKKIPHFEETSHTNGKNYYSSSKSSPLNKKSSHNSDYTVKRDGKIFTMKESTPITYSEIVTRKFDNIINDEKAIFHMNQLVKLAREKNGENLN